ncbi:MAG TPA: sulfite exporter TauE/SafE family protein [Candidatus Dojkabacteria bacterium]|nr:sulfite exporter TauE/SafE family protein [Candidatus Dojkabacteria bacterium]
MKSKKDSNKVKTCTYFVEGMHCNSCELLIERSLLKNEQVKSADATLKDGKVEVTFVGNKITADQLSEQFKDLGYKFSDSRKSYVNNSPLIKIENDKLLINQEKFNQWIQTIVTVAIVLGLFTYLQNSGVSKQIVLNQYSSFWSFFLFGLLAGLSSCAALVGGLLLSMSKQWNEVYIEQESKLERLKPFLMFNTGRIISFIILGGFLGVLGGLLGLSIENATSFTAIVVLVVSVVMLILGLQMLEVKWANKIKIGLPKSITQNITAQEKFKGKFMPFLIGALTFLLPCGFTLIVQGLALTSGSFLQGSFIMLAFVLGTLPILLAISIASVDITRKPKLNAVFTKISGILVVVFAIYNLNAQLNVLGLKSLDDIKINSINKMNDNNNNYAQTDESGTQTLNLSAKGFKYVATSSTTLKAGVPTKLIVNNEGIYGCGAYMASRGLITGYVELQPGRNEIDLGEPQAGTYKITCSMGMVPPVTINVQ